MRGFRGFRGTETIPSDALEAKLSRLNIENRYIYWTGDAYNSRRESLRSNSLKALKVVKEPVALKDWIRLAARVVPDTEVGYDPAAVRAGLYLHHDSKPAVYFELRLEKDGSYTSVNPVPNALGFPNGLKAGDVVIPAPEKVEPAQIETAGKDIVQTPASKAKTVARKAARTKGKTAA
jgi:hypothetical protein